MYNNRKYWLACSGGLDSVVLAHILTLNHVNFGIVHCNFKLRGSESDQDEKFVIELAKKLNVPCETKVIEIDTSKNTQLSARDKRYEWFNKIIQEKSKVILAHHKDDQEETFWIQLERGAGVAGLVGMTSNHKGFIRPLLKYSKTEILQLAKMHKWEWREDASNTSTKYKRNFYRLDLLPVLRKSGVNQSTIIDLTHDYQRLFHVLKSIKIPESSEIKIQTWESYPIIFRHELLRRKNIAIHFEKEITKLCSSTKGSKIKVDNGTYVWHNGNTLDFKKKQEQTNSFKVIIKEIPPNEVEFTNEGFYFDALKIKGSIVVRKWKEGDHFRPLGMKGKKSISDFLTDRKVKSSQKRNVLVLEDEEKIVGVYGFVPSELVKIDEQTKNVLFVKVEEVKLSK
jgi:tRNA(Ile)-lysidine synthase